MIRAAAARGVLGKYTAGQVAVQAFQMFDQGSELKDIVIALQVTPEEMFRLHRLWQCSLDDPPPTQDMGGARLL